MTLKSATETKATKLSYKFQRLRENLRAAVASGELNGKLPGERVLARRFGVNAKTLSKALTDLAAEGLLERSIGRGTYVKGTAPEVEKAGKWLILCDDDHTAAVTKIEERHADVHVARDVRGMRPSFLNQFCAVIDLSQVTPDEFLRSLVVRNIPVVAVGREPKTYSMNAVVMDRALGLSKVARDLLLGGHSRILAVEERGSTIVSDVLRSTATRYGSAISVDSCLPNEVSQVIDGGATAVVCDSPASAQMAMEAAKRMDLAVPGRVSIVAVGSIWGEAPCSGYFLSAGQMTSALVELLKEQPTHRPVTIWLTGAGVDMGTSAPMETAAEGAEEMRISGIAV